MESIDHILPYTSFFALMLCAVQVPSKGGWLVQQLTAHSGLARSDAATTVVHFIVIQAFYTVNQSHFFILRVSGLLGIVEFIPKNEVKS